MGNATRRTRERWRAVRHELRRAAVAYLLLLLGLAVTVGVAGYVARQGADADRTRLDHDVAATQSAIADRLARYLDALQGARGLFAASDAVDRAGWDAYVRALDLQDRYPGTRSLAYARWVPAADEAAFLAEMRAGGIPEYAIPGAGGADAYVPLTYIAPLSAAARGALGFDALADPVRRPALERARDTGQPAATASTALASEPGGAEQRSVVLYVPVYRGGGVPGTVAARRAALQGFVLTGWRMDDLLAGLLGPASAAPLAFAIADDAGAGPGQVLYASDGVGAATTAAALARPDRRRTLAVAGRTWTIDFVARAAPDRLLPALVAGAGLALSLLLALLARAHVLRQAAATLREAAESFAGLFGASEAITINEGDAEGRVVAVNPAYTALLGWEPALVVGRPGAALVVPADRAASAARAVTDDERPYTVRLRRKDGTTVATEVVGRAIRYQGRPARLATLRDVTERARAEEALRASEARYRDLVDNAGDLIYTHDLAGRFTSLNRAAERLIGYTLAAHPGLGLRDLVPPAGYDAAWRAVERDLSGADPQPWELTIRARDGHCVTLEVTTRLLRDGGGAPLGVQGIGRDVGERRALEARLAHQATHDALTGLPNRALFLDRLAYSLARRDRAEIPAVLFVDLDRFKAVNDSLGHDAGDRLLAAVAGRLRDCLRGADTAARFGGDEFAVLLDRVADLPAAVRVAERIVARVGLPVALGDREVVVTPSVGIALGADVADTAEDLLRFADVAMYRAKALGPGCYEVFYPGMHADALPRLALERDLRLALERGEFVLHYQPLVALPGRGVIGVEALVRWRHPARGLVPPGDFIPLAEETGLILPLGRWVLDEACRQGRAWRDARPDAPPLTISVNVAARQLRSTALLGDVARALAETGLPPGDLQLEITEGAAMADAAATVVILQELKDLGVRLALDDFGTGHSSLAYLKRFPVDALKVDKAFVTGLGRDPEDAAIVGAIVTLARALGLGVTAEGVETVAQAAVLGGLGCDTGQGYLFARPLPAEEVAGLVGHGPAPGRGVSGPTARPPLPAGVPGPPG